MPLVPPRALLLDLDDTILAYGAQGPALWREMTALVAGELGVDAERVHGAVIEAGRRFWGDPERSARGRHDMRGSRRVLCLWAFRELGLPELAAAQLADAFHDAREAGVHPLPGAVDALEALRRRGLPLVLVTNGGPELQRRKIERFDLAGFFDAIFVEGELGFGKPDPRVFRLALEAARAEPDHAWMVGDNLHADVAGAQAVGVTGIWMDHADEGIPEGSSVEPDHTVTTLAEISELT